MADVLPDSQRPPNDWAAGTTVGIPGGIDAATSGWTVVDVTAYGVSEANTSAQNGAAFNAAKNAAPTTNKVLYFPEGTYEISGPSPATNQVVRGAGMFRTILRGVNGISLGGSSAWSGAEGRITAGLNRGSQTLTVAHTNASAFVNTRMIRITIPNDIGVPVTTWNADQRASRSLYIMVTTATNLGGGMWSLQLDNPIPGNYTFPAAYPDVPSTPIYAVVTQSQLNNTVNCGVEDLTIENQGTVSSVQGGIRIGHGWKMWAKNVHMKNSGTYNVFNTSSSYRFEMRGCFCEGSGLSQNPRHSIRVQDLSFSLIEDNIFYKSNASTFFFEGAAAVNSISHNLILDGLSYGLGPNHQHHPQFNLFEYNLCGSVNVDGYHGTSSEATFNGNWFMGVNSVTRPSNNIPVWNGWNFTTGLPNAGSELFCVSIKRWSYNYYLIRNLFKTPGFTASLGEINYGQPHIGNGSWTGEVNPHAGVYWEDYNVAAHRPYKWTGTVLERTMVSSSNFTALVQFTGGDDFAKFVSRALTASTDPSVSNRVATTIFWTGGVGYGHSAYADINIGAQQAYLRGLHAAPEADTILTICPFSTSFHELDLGSRPVTKRNRNISGDLVLLTAGSSASSVGTVTSGDFEAGETALVSYTHAAQPDFMAGYNWPPIDVDNIDAGTLGLRRIPAGTRFLNWQENGTFDDVLPSTPVFSPAAGQFDTSQSITITAVDPIYYTTDGSTPDNTDSPYTTPIPISTTTVLKAVAYDGATYSLVRTGTFTLKAATPYFSPLAGTYEGSQVVQALTTTSGATVFYETGATIETTANPTISSPSTPNPILVTSSIVIKAVAAKTWLENSDVRTGVFTINTPAEPAPDAPSGLTATTVSSSQIDLSWTDNSDNEGGFKVYRGTSSGVLVLIETVEAGVTTYSDEGLAPETTYFYAVTATNETDDSAATNEVSATTNPSSQPAPTRPRLGRFPKKSKNLG